MRGEIAVSIHLDVSPQAEARFTAAALKSGMDPSVFFEVMVAAYLPTIEPNNSPTDFGGRSLADLMNEIGFAEGGAEDMSENPSKYLKGFGIPKGSK